MQDLIGDHSIKDGKVVNNKLEIRQGKRKTCNTTTLALCCIQVINTNTFKLTKQKKFSTYTILLQAKGNGLFTYDNVFYAGGR